MASKSENLDNSQNDVITTMTHVLYRFQEMVSKEMPSIPVVYTEDLSYESALKQIIANASYGGHAQDSIPFFAYNRTVLNEIEDRALSRRAKNCIGCQKVGDQQITYGCAYGEFDIQFLYVSNNIELTEKFEVVYNSDEGISGTKELIVDMEELGQFKYFLDYQDLVEQQISHEDVYYKGIIGSIKVRGFYFTFRGASGLIEEINQRIITSRDIPNREENEILSDIQIV